MCRWIAYRGEPVLLESLISTPEHSLLVQSMHASEAKTATNGDGFGIGWYGERETPGLFREIRPAWSDENLRAICAHMRSALFFAHVRASTGTASTRANCHPFTYGEWMFMHNGQIGGYARVRRRVEDLIPDALYAGRNGTTDSEAIFLTALGADIEADAPTAFRRTLGRIESLMSAAGNLEPMRFTAALSNGRDLYAFRYSSDDFPPTLYWRESETSLLVVSEPLDGQRASWQALPKNAVLIALQNQPPVIREFAAAA